MRKTIEELESFLGSPLGEGLAVGQKISDMKIRVNRYASSIRVTDLTNAGKRGKTVDGFAFYDLDYTQDPKTLKDIEFFALKLSKGMAYKKAFIVAMSIIADAEKRGMGTVPKIETIQFKGIRVPPGDQGEVKVNGKHVSFRSDPGSGFSIRDKDDKNNEPVMMTPFSGPTRKSIAAVYAWALHNKDFIKKATFSQIRDVFKKEKINYHYYLAMD